MKKEIWKAKRIKELKQEIEKFEKGKVVSRFFIYEAPFPMYEKNEWMENIQYASVNEKNPKKHFRTRLLLEYYEEYFDIEMDEDEYDEEELKKWEFYTLDNIGDTYHLSEKPIEFYEELAKESHEEYATNEDNIIDRWWLGDENRFKPITWEELDDEEQEGWIKDAVAKRFARHEKNWKLKW